MSRCLYILLLLSCLLCACRDVPCAGCMSVREAQRTAAVADSLRVNEGRLYDDSLALAEAYSTFGRWRYIYPNDYARACYYYGRLLRNRGDQVAAMQAFIAGSHATYVQRVMPLLWFSDYHILGRIYSNMGTMCHLVDEFELSYDMYEQSAKAFQKSGDTTAYYYALIDMALELAEQKMHDETLNLLKRVELECSDSEVLTKVWETRAILYNNLAQYDSAIYSAKQLYSYGYYAATGYVVIAQAFWCLHQIDSALYYANLAVNQPYASEQDKYHMLYILSNCDTTIDTKTVQELAARRADINIEYIEPLLQQLSVAANLLHQDLDYRRPFLNIILLLSAVCLVGLTTWLARTRTRRYTIREQKKHQLLAKANADISQSNEQIQRQYLDRQERLVQEIERNAKVLHDAQDWTEKLHWKEYDAFCQSADHYFLLLASKLKSTYHLDEKEIRLCVLVLMEMDNKTIAQTIHYAPNGIGKFKYRIAQKLGTTIKDLRKFLLFSVICG